jgi:NitT/TauT family transport system ATP-binding protein
VSVDAATAVKLRDELAQLVGRRPVTTLMVTHDIDEAVELADRIIVLSPAPARILGDIRIDKPRAARRAAETGRLSEEIRSRMRQTQTDAE